VQREVEKAAGLIVSHPVTCWVFGTKPGGACAGAGAAMNVETVLETGETAAGDHSRLPEDILIRKMEECRKFDVRTARRKRYRYLIWAAKGPAGILPAYCVPLCIRSGFGAQAERVRRLFGGARL